MAFSKSSSSLSRFCAGSLALALLLALGCKEKPAIETYSIEPTTSVTIPFDSSQAAAITERLDCYLVAIVPQGKQAWFFKMVGKTPVIERQRQAFLDFLATVKPASRPGGTPGWELPEDWSTSDKVVQFRSATIVVPDVSGDLEIAVSSLVLSDDWDTFLLINVTRWLRQLGQPKLPIETIHRLAKQSPTAGKEATVFELSGVMPQKPMGGMAMGGNNPHAGLGIAPPPAGAKLPQASASPPKNVGTMQQGPLKYKTPAGWAIGNITSMRKAAFLLSEGGQAGEVTVMDFPAAPGTQMGDVTANVQRWAGQVGLTLATAEEVKKITKPITISEIEGTFVELTSPEETVQKKSIHAAMILKGQKVWFFKMFGNPELVSKNKAAFREFLDSVQFK